MSSRALREALQKVVPGIRVFIIDRESKDTVAGRRILRGEVAGWDVVICTPVAQSGVSWVGVFAETVFVAGGRTLPPNICGGQAGRRERTATTCVAYVPNTTWDRSLPLWGLEADAIRGELHQARKLAADLPIARGHEIELLERVYVLAAQRQIEELALFLDYTLHYARLDGWATEEMLRVEPIAVKKNARGDSKERNKPMPVDELNPWHALLVRSLMLQAVGADKEVEETKASALQATQQMQQGSAGADLVSANLTDVQELLLNAGLGLLCDGTYRSSADPLVKSVAEALQSVEAKRFFVMQTGYNLN